MRTLSLSMCFSSSGQLDVSRAFALAVGLMKGSSSAAAPDDDLRRFFFLRSVQAQETPDRVVQRRDAGKRKAGAGGRARRGGVCGRERCATCGAMGPHLLAHSAAPASHPPRKPRTYPYRP